MAITVLRKVKMTMRSSFIETDMDRYSWSIQDLDGLSLILKYFTIHQSKQSLWMTHFSFFPFLSFDKHTALNIVPQWANRGKVTQWASMACTSVREELKASPYSQNTFRKDTSKGNATALHGFFIIRSKTQDGHKEPNTFPSFGKRQRLAL